MSAALLGLFGLVLLIVFFSCGRPEKPDSGIGLVASIEELPLSGAKTIVVSVPQAGTLTVDLSLAQGKDFSVWLRLGSPMTAQARGAQPIERFTAKGITTNYRRSAPIERGEYELVLFGLPPGEGALATRVRVSVRLTPRRRRHLRPTPTRSRA